MYIVLKNRKKIDREYLSILVDISFHHRFLFLRLIGFLNFFQLNKFKVVIEKNILFSRIDEEFFSFPSISRISQLFSVKQIQSCRWEKYIILKNRKSIDRREYLSILIDISFHHPFLRLVEDLWRSMKFLLILLNRFKIVEENILFSRIERGSIENICQYWLISYFTILPLVRSI